MGLQTPILILSLSPGSRALQLMYKEYQPKEGDTIGSILTVFEIDVRSRVLCQPCPSSSLRESWLNDIAFDASRSPDAD